MAIKEEIKLYGGEVTLTYYPTSHQYKRDGEKVYGVTSSLNIINKPGLIFWAANTACDYLIDLVTQGREISAPDIEIARRQHTVRKEEAAVSGTQVHKWAEQYIKGKKPETPTDPEVLNGVTAFLDWVAEHNVQFINSERFVYSKKHNYAGQMDAEAIIDGKKCVIDFKTSKGIYNEMFYQTAAYQKAAEEEGSTYDGDRWIVRFDKDTGEFEAYPCDEVDKDYQAFLATLTLKQRESELK